MFQFCYKVWHGVPVGRCTRDDGDGGRVVQDEGEAGKVGSHSNDINLADGDTALEATAVRCSNLLGQVFKVRGQTEL
jgi:hypothetical protein